MYHHLKMEMLSPLFPPPPDLDDRWPTTDDDSFTNPGESNHLFSPAGLTSPHHPFPGKPWTTPEPPPSPTPQPPPGPITPPPDVPTPPDTP